MIESDNGGRLTHWDTTRYFFALRINRRTWYTIHIVHIKLENLASSFRRVNLKIKVELELVLLVRLGLGSTSTIIAHWQSHWDTTRYYIALRFNCRTWYIIHTIHIVHMEFDKLASTFRWVHLKIKVQLEVLVHSTSSTISHWQFNLNPHIKSVVHEWNIYYPDRYSRIPLLGFST